MNRTTLVFGACALALGGLLFSSIECGNSSNGATGASSGDGGTSGSATEGGTGTTGATSGTGGATSDASDGATSDGSDGATTGSTGGTVDMSVDVLMRNKHPSRDGVYVQPTLTKANVGTMALDTNFFNVVDAGTGDSGPVYSGAVVDGPEMQAQILYLSKGPGGTGVFFAVTTHNSVYALDETTGATVWQVSLGPDQMINTATCVDEKTRGIISTPVIDPTPGPDGFPTMYVSSYLLTTAPENQIFALSTKDGSTRPGWPVHVSALQAAVATDAGFPGFTGEAQNQRGALALVNGILYAGYGSHGDCGLYRGWVVAINTADPTKTGVFMTRDQGGAVWAPGGLASDGDGIITVTGNGAGDAGVHLDDNMVIRLRGMATLTRDPKNTFYPTGSGPTPLWQKMDQTDMDLGATNPVVFSAGGKTYFAIASKNGEFFMFDAANFGGTDNGDLVPPGGAYLKIGPDQAKVVTVPAAYTSSSGTHVVLSVANPLGCPQAPDGGVVNDAGTPIPFVMSILVTPGATPSLKVAWCSQTSVPPQVPAPMVTTSDGTHDYIVWFVNGVTGLLTGVDADTGETLVTASGACPNMRKFSTPIAVKGRIVTGADGHLCSWSVH
jgi:hypothetical protein